ncbi:S8 family peptidase [Sanguibacter suaedae]|uniref:S8 family serine peptidase n=1 Tax=Sanguibacter suaedae TaxID=2795737 RepID=A0A934IA31_9MICO|nr:S8 family serine peptidase [Sanguibacter suaedae]MBI9114965.1 S8 family serine peptidase [Sanguibacter suaedae]
MRSRKTMRTTAVLSATLAAALAASGLPAVAEPADDEVTGFEIDAAPDRSAVLSPRIADLEGRVSVFVQTSGESALDADQKAKATQRSQSQGQSDAGIERAAEIADTAATIEDTVLADDPQAEVLYVSEYSVPGVALAADADAIRDLADETDVVRISLIVPRSIPEPQAADPQNANSADLVQTIDTWTQTGQTGDGVTVAVIDTGVDYTHAGFGGPGTAEAYAAAVASTDAPQEGWYDPEKYLGGYDFAGPTYNADPRSPAYDPVPAPDANPVDGEGGGHGSHVAGTTLGYGIDTEGETFEGDYTTLTRGDLDAFDLGPGAAPDAGLYALKVFGDAGGSTDLTGAAIDWVGRSIAEGNPIDIINLSLGSDYGVVDDPDNAKIAALMDHGVLPVIAAGNAGDLTDVGGSPGNTGRSLAVAATSNGHSLLDAMVVTAPGDLAAGSPYPGQYSVNYSGDFAVSGTVAAPVAPDNLEGCQPFDEEDAALLSGKIAWLEWDDDNIVCGSGTRFANAAAAGATGVILTSELDAFESGIAGSTTIPGLQITGTATAALTDAAHDGTLQVELRSDLKGASEQFDGALVDTPAGFTSRGVHGSYDDIVKPDVAAPGVSIISVDSGTGTGKDASSGTSMASPLVAGIAALVAQARPDWTPDDIKAAVMNTATHDVTVEGDDATPYGPLRVGTGRVDAFQAVTTAVTVRTLDAGGLVTASFGVVEVGAEAVTAQRTLQVTNHGDQPVDYTLAYLPRTTVPGVEYTLDTESVSLAPWGTAEVTVTMTIADPAALRRTIDPTMETVQDGLVREFVAAASGVVELTPTSGESSRLRVAVFSAPEPVSDMSAAGEVRFADAKATTAPLVLQGRSVLQGEGAEGYMSLFAPFQLGIEDPAEEFPEGSARQTLTGLDVRYAGAASTAPQLADPSQGVLAFGIAMEGDTATLGVAGYPVVSIDVDGDGETDFETYVTRLTDIDVSAAATVDAEGTVVDLQTVNVQPGGRDANVFDTSTVVLPVSLAALGYTADSTETTISYSVHTESYYAPGAVEDPSDVVVDQTDAATFDVFEPTVWFGGGIPTTTGTVVFQDTPGTLTVNRTVPSSGQVVAPQGGAETAKHGKGRGKGKGKGPKPGQPPAAPVEVADVLLLHLHNASGDRTEVVPVTQTAATPTPAPTDPPKPCIPRPPWWWWPFLDMQSGKFCPR